MRPAVITVAITGSVPRKKDNPALPVTVSEWVICHEIGHSVARTA